MFHFVEFYRIRVSESVLISAPQGEGYGCGQRGLSVHSSFCFCLSIDGVIARCPKYKTLPLWTQSNILIIHDIHQSINFL